MKVYYIHLIDKVYLNKKINLNKLSHINIGKLKEVQNEIKNILEIIKPNNPNDIGGVTVEDISKYGYTRTFLKELNINDFLKIELNPFEKELEILQNKHWV